MSDTESKSATILSQYITDRCLAEIERRGELEFDDGVPIIPYCSDHVIETVLTRDVEAPPQTRQ